MKGQQNLFLHMETMHPEGHIPWNIRMEVGGLGDPVTPIDNEFVKR